MSRGAAAAVAGATAVWDWHADSAMAAASASSVKRFFGTNMMMMMKIAVE